MFRHPTRSLHRLIPAVLLLSTLFAAGCEDSVNPFVEADRYFTIFGYLDTAVDTQFVRVIPLRMTLGGTADPDIDAVVTSSAADHSEQTYTWRDSVVVMPDESIAHIFYAPFRPIPGWTYTLDVRRSDGQTASAATTVPVAGGADVESPSTAPYGFYQNVFWQNVDFTPFRVEIWYRFVGDSPSDRFQNVVLDYTDTGDLTADGWKIPVELSKDHEKVMEALHAGKETRLYLAGVGMRLAITDDRWRPPRGVFDADILVQPGTFSNVSHGFGYFGSINQYTVEWALDAVTTQKLGYRLPE